MTLKRKIGQLTIALVLVLLFVSEKQVLAQSFNQRHNNTDYLYQGNSVETQERPVVFYFFPYSGGLIDLRAYKKLELVPELPDQVAIDLPDMSGFSDTTIGIAHLEYWDRKDTLYIPVICLVGDMSSPQPTFIFDRDLDRDYRNEDWLTFGTKRKFYNIQLKDANGKTYGFSLENFKLTEAKNAIRQMKQENRKKITPELEAKTHQLTAGLNLNIGFGQMRYEYETDSLGLPVSYLRNFSATGVVASLNYSWQQRLNIETRLAYSNIFYWTSTKTVYITPEFLLEKINRDNLPASRFAAELNLGYNFQLGSDVLIRPYMGYSIYKMSNNNSYQPERSQVNTYTLQKRNFIVVGIRPHVQINSRTMAFIDFAYKSGEFYAEGFFEAENAARVIENPLREFRIGLGMNYRFL